MVVLRDVALWRPCAWIRSGGVIVGKAQDDQRREMSVAYELFELALPFIHAGFIIDLQIESGETAIDFTDQAGHVRRVEAARVGRIGDELAIVTQRDAVLVRI